MRYFAAIVYFKLCTEDVVPCIAVIRISQVPGFAAVLITIGIAPVASGAGRSATCFAIRLPPTQNSAWIFAFSPIAGSGYTTKYAYGLPFAETCEATSGTTRWPWLALA